MATVTGSVLFYVQHLLGIGHVRRALRIVEALAKEGLRVTLVAGGEPHSAFDCAAADQVVQLPPIKARDAGFKELIDMAGRPIDDELRGERRATLLAAFAAAQPDAILIEAFPFGRRAFRFELDPLIDAARARRPRPLVLCSLRDIVVAPDDVKRRREIVDRVREDFDHVLVHGDPAFIPLETSFPEALEIADRLIYTGYVGEVGKPRGTARPRDAEKMVGAGEVIVSVGGGAVGGALLAAALETRRRGFLKNLAWRLLTGPNLSNAEFESLAARLPEAVSLERYRTDFRQLLRGCRVSVSQAGYNTMLDILEARAAAVVVPFAAERETEQSLRAERLASRGVIQLVREDHLSPERLADAIERAISCRPREITIATRGARCAASFIAGLIRGPVEVAGRTVEEFVLRRTGAMINP
jgi:predicted glycosyltransferase